MKTKIKISGVSYLAAVFCLLFSVSTIAAEQTRVLVVGDSLSAGFGLADNEGWVTLLQQENPHWQVINASISGDTTSGGVRRLPNLLTQYEPMVVIIELGGNDGLRGQPLRLIEKNLHRMIEMTQQQGATPLLLEMKIPPNYGPQYSGRFTQIYRQLAAQMQVTMVPFFLETIAAETGMMQADGIHPTAAAQPIMMRQVAQALKTLPIEHHQALN